MEPAALHAEEALLATQVEEEEQVARQNLRQEDAPQPPGQQLADDAEVGPGGGNSVVDPQPGLMRPDAVLNPEQIEYIRGIDSPTPRPDDCAQGCGQLLCMPSLTLASSVACAIMGMYYC